MERLGCGRATFERIKRDMRLYLDAPIEYDAEFKGYYYAKDGNFSLPGLWFSASELRALLTLQQLLGGLAPGLLGEQLKPFRDRVEKLLDNQQAGTGDLQARLRVVGMGVRAVDSGPFGTVASALAERKRLRIDYLSRSRDEGTERNVSPQRLVHYRENWYLDAWCHMRDGPRLFAIDRIGGVSVLDEPALEEDAEVLDERLESAYGIFQGEATSTAKLR